MYNRYIPQPDGTYRRSRMQDPVMPQRSFTPPPRREEVQEPNIPAAEVSEPPESQRPHDPPKTPSCPRRQGRQSQPHRQHQRQTEADQTQPDANVGGFFQNLLPKDFDTGDLLIVLLLLLMAGDCKEDQNTALLTLALYLFM